MVDEATRNAREYDYLLKLPLWSLTFERVEQLKAQLSERESEVASLE